MNKITMVGIVVLLCIGCRDDKADEQNMKEIEKDIELNIDKATENEYGSNHFNSTDNGDPTIDSLIDLQIGEDQW